MARAKLTTKNLAQRIDLEYFKHPHPFRRLRFILSVALPVIALLWLGWHALARNDRIYSGGRMSASHAVLTRALQRVPRGAGGRVQRQGQRSGLRFLPRRAACITRIKFSRQLALRAMQSIADTRAWR